MNQEERIRRADKAKQLLSDDTLQSAFDDVREGLVKAIESCGWGDEAKQKNLMLSLQLLKGLKGTLQKHIEDGKVAAKEIERYNNPKVKRIA